MFHLRLSPAGKGLGIRRPEDGPFSLFREVHDLLASGVYGFPRGRWRIAIEARGFEAAEREFDIQDGSEFVWEPVLEARDE